MSFLPRSFFLGCRLLLAILGGSAFAADPVTLPDPLVVQGKEYSRAVYASRDHIWLSFHHADGSSRVRIADLPSELQTAIGYDPVLAEQQARDEILRKSIARATAETIQRNKQVIQGVVARNTLRGLLVETSVPTGEVKEITRKIGDQYETTREPIYEPVLFCVSGHPNAVYFKPDTTLTLEVLPEGVDYVEGAAVIKARFLRDVK